MIDELMNHDELENCCDRWVRCIENPEYNTSPFDTKEGRMELLRAITTLIHDAVRKQYRAWEE